MHDAKADAQRLDLGDDDRGEEGAGNRAHAADHHDDEGVADHDQVEREIGRLARHLQRAADAGERRRRSANTTVNSSAWLTPSAPTISRSCVAARISRPKRVLRQHQMQQQKDGRADDDQEEVVAREVAAEDLDRAAQSRRARPEQVFRSPQVHSVASLMTSTSAKVASSWNSSGAW